MTHKYQVKWSEVKWVGFNVPLIPETYQKDTQWLEPLGELELYFKASLSTRTKNI